jgi:hypothetical protein
MGAPAVTPNDPDHPTSAPPAAATGDGGIPTPPPVSSLHGLWGGRGRRRDRQRQAQVQAQGRGRPGRDLGARAFPVITPEDWRDPGETMTVLYRHAEATAMDAINWYLRDKRGKKRLSQLLRAASILLVAAGGLQPLLAAGGVSWASSDWGYVLLALAAACIGFDRFLGVSSAWMRDIITAQALQRHLATFQLAWAAACAQVASGPGGDQPLTARLTLLQQFGDDLQDLVQSETTEWVTEFHTNLTQFSQFETHTTRPWVTTPAHRRARVPISQLEGAGRAQRPVGAARTRGGRGPVPLVRTGRADVPDPHRPIVAGGALRFSPDLLVFEPAVQQLPVQVG